VETYKQIGVEGSRVTFAEPRVHAFVYEPTTGEAKKLPVDFYAYLKVTQTSNTRSTTGSRKP
jgi:hypothetical protein